MKNGLAFTTFQYFSLIKSNTGDVHKVEKKVCWNAVHGSLLKHLGINLPCNAEAWGNWWKQWNFIGCSWLLYVALEFGSIWILFHNTATALPPNAAKLHDPQDRWHPWLYPRRHHVAVLVPRPWQGSKWFEGGPLKICRAVPRGCCWCWLSWLKFIGDFGRSRH